MCGMNGGRGTDWGSMQIGIALVAERIGKRDACGRDGGGGVNWMQQALGFCNSKQGLWENSGASKGKLSKQEEFLAWGWEEGLRVCQSIFIEGEGVTVWLSGKRIWCCHCCGMDYFCGAGLTSGLECSLFAATHTHHHH